MRVFVITLILFLIPFVSVQADDSFLGKWDVVDLSHTYKDGMPIYPGGAGFVLENMATIDQGYYINKFSTGEHVGTHIDAPSHFSATGIHAADIPLQQLIGPLVVLDVTDQAREHADYEVTRQDILDWEAQHGPVPEGAFVILNSDWWKRWDDGKAYLNAGEDGKMRFPGFSKESVEFLLNERSIKGVGADTLSTDHGSSHTFDEHYLLLGAGKVNLENLTHLDQVPAAGATLVVAPIRIEKGSGAPARVFALVPKE